jgi:hypothetical protein
MKKLVSASIAVALLSSASVTAASPGDDRKLSLVGVDFLYDPNATYNEIGTTSGSKALYDTNGDGLNDVDSGEGVGQSMTFATLRDHDSQAAGGDLSFGLNDSKQPDGSPGADGKGDATFGDINYADRLSSITVQKRVDPNDPESSFGETVLVYDTQPLALDFRIVLEEKITGAGTYNVIEQYSFFDILTQDGATDWGLALDTLDTGDAKVIVNELTGPNNFELTLITTGIAGEVFNNSDETNNLPWDKVDADQPITFGFTFQEQIIYDWDMVNTGSGDGNVIYTRVPEPSSLGLLGLALAGFGIMQRRRKQK